MTWLKPSLANERKTAEALGDVVYHLIYHLPSCNPRKCRAATVITNKCPNLVSFVNFCFNSNSVPPPFPSRLCDPSRLCAKTSHPSLSAVRISFLICFLDSLSFLPLSFRHSPATISPSVSRPVLAEKRKSISPQKSRRWATQHARTAY